MPGGRVLVGHVMPLRSRGDRWTCTSAGPKKCIRELLLLLDHDFRSSPRFKIELSVKSVQKRKLSTNSQQNLDSFIFGQK